MHCSDKQLQLQEVSLKVVPAELGQVLEVGRW